MTKEAPSFLSRLFFLLFRGVVMLVVLREDPERDAVHERDVVLARAT